MAGLSSLLYVGASGLSASQQGVQTTSDNIANVDTPGFHRREAVQTSRPTHEIGGVNVGSGVQVEQTRRIVDGVLDGRARDAHTEVELADGRVDVLRQAESIFGDLEGHGVSTALDGLFDAFDQLAAEPQDTGARQQVLAAADQFAESLNFVAGEVGTLQLEVDRRIDEQVTRINELSEEIAGLNLRIGGLPNPPSDLLDQRDAAVSELAGLVGVNVVESDQRLYVSLRGSGFGLVSDGVVQPLSASVVSGAAVISGTRNGSVEDLTSKLTGGRLTGTLQARNVDLQRALDQLDQLAFDVANAVNAAHSAGFGLDGVGGRALFSVGATAAGAAGSITVDPALADQPDRVAAATDPLLVPGDNRNALALSDLRASALPSGEAPGAALRSIFSDFGGRLSTAAAAVDARTAVKDHLVELQASMSGVNLDEEMTKLLQYRQSYAAAARVIRTADELMQEVVSLKR